MEVNGISLHVEDHGGGPPVVLLHGWPDSSHLWRNQIRFLVSHRFRAIAPDLRGFGRSERPADVSAYELRNWIGDVVGVLDDWGSTPRTSSGTTGEWRSPGFWRRSIPRGCGSSS